MPKISAPPSVVGIVTRLEAEGFETWAVGGAVRDALSGAARGDWDLATRARPEEVQSIFRRTVPVGVEHGTVGVFGKDRVMYEVTTFRRDVLSLGRKALVSFSDTIDEDLSRRDFTINAMAWHPIRDEFKDPFHGEKDLADSVLRAVGDPAERFQEDYLRILRAFRFAGRFDLTIEEATWAGMLSGVSNLGQLSRERIREELWKVMELRLPARSLSLYQESGALSQVVPELSQPLDSSGLELVNSLGTRPLLRMAALFSLGLEGIGPEPWLPEPRGVGSKDGSDGNDAGFKGRETRFRGREKRFKGREKRAAVLTKVLEGLRFSTQDIRATVATVGAGRFPLPSLMDPLERRRWMAATGRPFLRRAVRLWIAAHRGRSVGEGGEDLDPTKLLRLIGDIRKDVSQALPLAVNELALGGGGLMALGVKPGPEMGRVLRVLLEAVWHSPEMNTEERLKERLLALVDSDQST